MRVLTGASPNAMVAFEVSQDNFNWLYEAVQFGVYDEVSRQTSQSRAKLGEELADAYKNVHWRQQRKTLWTTYRQNGKTRTLSKRISSCSDEEREATKLEREAARLQGLRNSMHEKTPSKRCKKSSSPNAESHADAEIVQHSAASDD